MGRAPVKSTRALLGQRHTVLLPPSNFLEIEQASEGWWFFERSCWRFPAVFWGEVWTVWTITISSWSQYFFCCRGGILSVLLGETCSFQRGTVAMQIFCLEFNRPAQVVCHVKIFCTDILVPFLYLPSCFFLFGNSLIRRCISYWQRLRVFLTLRFSNHRRGNWSLTHEGWLASTKSFTTGMGVWLQWQRGWLRSLDFSSLEKGEQFFLFPLNWAMGIGTLGLLFIFLGTFVFLAGSQWVEWIQSTSNINSHAAQRCGSLSSNCDILLLWVLRVGHILGFPRRRSLSFVWQLWGWCNAWSLQLNSRNDWNHQKRRLHHVLIVTSDPAWYPVILLSCLCFGRCQAWLHWRECEG